MRESRQIPSSHRKLFTPLRCSYARIFECIHKRNGGRQWLLEPDIRHNSSCILFCISASIGRSCSSPSILPVPPRSQNTSRISRYAKSSGNCPSSRETQRVSGAAHAVGHRKVTSSGSPAPSSHTATSVCGSCRPIVNSCGSSVSPSAAFSSSLRNATQGFHAVLEGLIAPQPWPGNRYPFQ